MVNDFILLQMLAKTLISNSMMMKRRSMQSQDLKLSEVVPFLGMVLWPFLPRLHVLTG